MSVSTSIPRIFDTQRIVHNRGRGCAQSIQPLIDHLTQDLIERLSCIMRTFQNILEIWPLSHQLHDALIHQYPQSSYASFGACLGESATPMAHHPFDGTAQFPFEPHTYDFIVGQLSWHFINDLPGVLSQLHRDLKPDGLMLSQLFGGDTLCELNHVMHHVMLEKYGGVRPIIAPFLTPQQGGMLLQRAGLNVCVVDRTTLTLYYDDMWSLLRDIKSLGAQACLVHSMGTLTQGFINACQTHYVERFGVMHEGAMRIPVTLDILTLSGWAPDAASQQKPLAPHQAEHRLIDYV